MPIDEKINIHWMQRFDGGSPQELKTLSNVLEFSGYYSTLTVYHSKISDYWIKIANIINPEHKLKYMIAMRTYAISPEYCAMMCEGFNEISPDRLILNIAAGDLHSDENSRSDVVAISNLLETHEDRVKYTSEWLEKFTSLPLLKSKPEIVVSGTSDGTILNSEKYADIHLCMYSSYKQGLSDLIKTKRILVAAPVIIRDTKEEAEKLHSQLPESMGKTSCLFGTENEIIEQILDMKSQGITDLLVSKVEIDDEHYRIHRMVRNMNDI
jgi:alkanesulfonate monooxygenase SsuD/methylene tetrahydromethanopterin reductase-like flavin-dependent oxidoreductase (luciferase family)